jgi:hypothetical protein
MTMRRRAVLLSGFTVGLRGLRMFPGVFMFALIVVMGGRVVVICRGLMVSGGLLMVFAGGMFCHGLLLDVR